MRLAVIAFNDERADSFVGEFQFVVLHMVKLGVVLQADSLAEAGQIVAVAALLAVQGAGQGAQIAAVQVVDFTQTGEGGRYGLP